MPFVARYRKEATGSLDEVAIAAIRDRLAQLAALDERRAAIVASLAGAQSADRRAAGQAGRGRDAGGAGRRLPAVPAQAPHARHDGPRTRARAAGRALLRQDPRVDPTVEAADSSRRGRVRGRALRVPDVDAALQGARDIIAERVNDDAGRARAHPPAVLDSAASCAPRSARGKEPSGAKFKDYFDWSEPIASAPSHRVLAILRGEAEEILSCSIEPPEEDALAILERAVRARLQPRAPSRCAWPCATATSGCSRGRWRPRRAPKPRRRADAAAIGVFAAEPAPAAAGAAARPEARAGDRSRPAHRLQDRRARRRRGSSSTTTVIYLDQGQQRTRATPRQLTRLVENVPDRSDRHRQRHGAAAKPRPSSARSDLPRAIAVVMVNESGASVYSASDVAREEFPDRDITVRGAVSIGRRLMDPLAELVKLDAKSIGVGQYQHDVDQDDLQALARRRRHVVRQRRRRGGQHRVEAVAGVRFGPECHRRRQHRALPQRARSVQAPPRPDGGAAPRRRRPSSRRPDSCASAAPPTRSTNPPSIRSPTRSSTAWRRTWASSVRDLISNERCAQRIDATRYVTASVGLPTLHDILAELAKPGRDPRATFEVVHFAEGISTLEDVRTGHDSSLAIVTNVTAFGAFVDIGVHQDGLVHISQLADRFVRDPNEVVKVQQPVQVTVLEVDVARNGSRCRCGAMPLRRYPECDFASTRLSRACVHFSFLLR